MYGYRFVSDAKDGKTVLSFLSNGAERVYYWHRHCLFLYLRACRSGGIFYYYERQPAHHKHQSYYPPDFIVHALIIYPIMSSIRRMLIMSRNLAYAGAVVKVSP